MALMMPIQPEPASRIYAGKKLFELRKFRPPETGFVYLYESRDATENVQAIRGGVFFREFLDLPLDKLWERVGERATTREKFLRYFGPRHKHGIAIVIERVERLSSPITLSQLRAVDSTFELPRGLWTYFVVSDDAPVIKYLNAVPRQDIFGHEANVRSSIVHDLRIAPLSTQSEAAHFEELYNLYVRPNYPESEDYADFVLRIHREGFDPFGYFTKRKTVWVLMAGQKSVGFTVVTEKRGGSIKFGPTVLDPERRGSGYGTTFRLMVEKKYPTARKAYNTLPDDNLAALKYVLRAGYQVEAHLRQQYRDDRGELVVGKLLGPSGPPPVIGRPPRSRGRAYLAAGTELPTLMLEKAIRDLLVSFYEDVDSGFVSGLLESMQGDFALSRKSKRVFLVMRAHRPLGIVIATPKRGGALKCAPLVVRGDDEEAFRLLLGAAEQAFPQRLPRRSYLQLPLLCPNLIIVAQCLGFASEGVLREPYRKGVDLLALGKVKR